MPKTVLMQQHWKVFLLSFTGKSAESQGKERHPAGLDTGLVLGWPQAQLQAPSSSSECRQAGKRLQQWGKGAPGPSRRRQPQPAERKGLRRLEQGQRRAIIEKSWDTVGHGIGTCWRILSHGEKLNHGISFLSKMLILKYMFTSVETFPLRGSKKDKIIQCLQMQQLLI